MVVLGFCLDWVGFCLCMAGGGIEAALWAFAYLFWGWVGILQRLEELEYSSIGYVSTWLRTINIQN